MGKKKPTNKSNNNKSGTGKYYIQPALTSSLFCTTEPEKTGKAKLQLEYGSWTGFWVLTKSNNWKQIKNKQKQNKNPSD